MADNPDKSDKSKRSKRDADLLEEYNRKIRFYLDSGDRTHDDISNYLNGNYVNGNNYLNDDNYVNDSYMSPNYMNGNYMNGTGDGCSNESTQHLLADSGGDWSSEAAQPAPHTSSQHMFGGSPEDHTMAVQGKRVKQEIDEDGEYIPGDTGFDDETYSEQGDKKPKINKDGQPRKTREPRGSLRRWDEGDLAKALCGIVWACGQMGLQIPFDMAAQMVDSACTASALQQAILKYQQKLNAAGAQIPHLVMTWPKKPGSVGKSVCRDRSKVPRRKPTMTAGTQTNLVTLRHFTDMKHPSDEELLDVTRPAMGDSDIVVRHLQLDGEDQYPPSTQPSTRPTRSAASSASTAPTCSVDSATQADATPAPQYNSSGPAQPLIAAGRPDFFAGIGSQFNGGSASAANNPVYASQIDDADMADEDGDEPTSNATGPLNAFGSWHQQSMTHGVGVFNTSASNTAGTQIQGQSLTANALPSRNQPQPGLSPPPSTPQQSPVQLVCPPRPDRRNHRGTARVDPPSPTPRSRRAPVSRVSAIIGQRQRASRQRAINARSSAGIPSQVAHNPQVFSGSASHGFPGPASQGSLNPDSQASFTPASQASFTPASQASFTPASQASFTPASQASFTPASQASFTPASQASFTPASQASFTPAIQGSQDSHSQSAYQLPQHPPNLMSPFQFQANRPSPFQVQPTHFHSYGQDWQSMNFAHGFGQSQHHGFYENTSMSSSSDGVHPYGGTQHMDLDEASNQVGTANGFPYRASSTGNRSSSVNTELSPLDPDFSADSGYSSTANDRRESTASAMLGQNLTDYLLPPMHDSQAASGMHTTQSMDTVQPPSPSGLDATLSRDLGDDIDAENDHKLFDQFLQNVDD